MSRKTEMLYIRGRARDSRKLMIYFRYAANTPRQPPRSWKLLPLLRVLSFTIVFTTITILQLFSFRRFANYCPTSHSVNETAGPGKGHTSPGRNPVKGMHLKYLFYFIEYSEETAAVLAVNGIARVPRYFFEIK